jgi:pilus assembly protein Flp/PilA
MATLYLKVRSWFQREEGQDLAEYALLIGLIALIVLGAVTLLGEELSEVFQGIATEVGGWF